MGWVNPRVGLVGLGWVEIFWFLVGWVGSWVWNGRNTKIKNLYTRWIHRSHQCSGRWWPWQISQMWHRVPKVVFLVPKGLLLFIWDRMGCGLGWVLGPNFYSGVGWVGLNKFHPLTTLIRVDSDGWKERKSCVSLAYKWWFKDIDEMRVLSGVVYLTKSRGPRTEPWGHHRDKCV